MIGLLGNNLEQISPWMVIYAVVGVLVSNVARDAYVYENDGNGNWEQLQKLESPDPHQFAHFGTTVAIDGDFIFIGSWGQHYDAGGTNYLQSAGAVYIFKKQASGFFDFHQKIVASDREALNAFGYGIAVDGDYAVVSPVRHDFDASGENFLDDAGAVYVFERDTNDTWNEVQKIVASDRAVQDFFGQSALAVSGNYIAVGSFADDEDENNTNTIPSAGSAYVFERDTNGLWTEIQKVVASDRAQGAFFGWSIGLEGNNMIIGSNQDNNSIGSAYVFERETNGEWIEKQKLTASNGINGDRFAQDLDIDGNRIVFGADRHDIASPGDDGAAYIFEKESGNWIQTAFIYDVFHNTSEYFGYTVALNGDYAFVGSYRDNEDENEENYIQSAGSALIFNADEPNALGVVEASYEKSVLVYPNPVQDLLNIDMDGFSDEVSILVFNTIGQQLISKTYKDTNLIPLEFNLPSGHYYVKVISNDKLVSVFKIVKQ